MKKKRNNFLSRLSSGQAGQALIIVLIFLMLGSLTLVPTLIHISTALKTGEVYEENTDENYAADSGVDDAIWQVKYDGLEALFKSPDYNYIFSSNVSYVLDDQMNRMTTNVTISNVWIPTNITSNITLEDLNLTPAQARDIIERDITDNMTNRLVVSGTPLDDDDYRIKIDYYPSADVADNLSLSSIGIWLPRGFTYDGDCNLDTFPDTQDKYIERSGLRPGGTAVVWDFSAVPLRFTDLPPEELESGDNPQTAEITFKYNNNNGDPTTRPNGIAWIVTSGPLANYSYPHGGGVPISWDIDTRIYKINSVAGNTEIEAYTSRCEMRNMYVSTPGDYVAIGNSLMTDEVNPKDGKFRTKLWPSTMTELSTLPQDAYVSHAYLYWSGFFSGQSGTPPFSTAFWGPDTCGNWNNWDRSFQTQPRVPTSDGDINGTWNTSPCWDDVDETSPVDTDFMTGTTDLGGYKFFNFSAFSIPTGSTVEKLTVYIRAKDVSGTNPNNNIRPAIKVNTTRYNTTSTSNDPLSGVFTNYSYSYTTNPDTSGAAWTVADINGTSSHALKQFGVYSSDLDPDIQVSMVYAVVTYSCWGVVSVSGDNQFRGQGYSSATDEVRTFTLQTAQDLHTRPAGSTIVEWMQTSSTFSGVANLEGDDDPANRDRLQFQFSGNNGLTWSAYITAFTGNLNPNGNDEYYYYVIPEKYLKSQFKIRFYLDGFNGSSEYCNIDDIALATITGTPDTSADFTVDGYDAHTYAVNALVSQLIGNKEKGQYSYSCWQDVTDMVNAHSKRNADGDPIGNAKYTVGAVSATTGGTSYELAYAGWSLVIIYHSASTAGRQLYLWNYFSYSKGNVNLDFDRDGSPGGTIKGFLVPHRIGNEAEAAKLTCFVGEGDYIYDGDQLIFNDHVLNDGYDVNNVWNSKSLGMSKDGVDIDTFHILWDDQILHAGDNQAQIDLVSETDNFNLIYLILSVRSKTTIGATTHYTIHGG